MNAAPPITVLMTVYNGRTYLAEAIDSILGQTHRDFELLIINDGSTDDSLALLKTYDDPRIRLVDQHPNQGIHATLNRGLAEARGRYLAIMDQDDISASRRLELQFARMEAQPDLSLCGCAIETFGDRVLPSWVRHFEPDALKVALLFENPVCHPSVMIRRSILAANSLRYPDIPYAEEYALWVALSRVSAITNLSEPLLRYRTHPQQVSRRRNDIQCDSMNRVLLDQFTHLGITASAQDLIVHKMLAGVFNPLPGYARKLKHWARRLNDANRAAKIYPEEEFSRQLESRVQATIALNKTRLDALSWPRRFAWRLSVMKDYRRATLPKAFQA